MADGSSVQARVRGDVRTRSKRSDAGRLKLTARDLTVLQWLSEQWGAPFSVVAQLLTPGTPRARAEASAAHVVARWQRAGWATSSRVDTGERWVFPSPATATRALGWTAHPWYPSPV